MSSTRSLSSRKELEKKLGVKAIVEISGGTPIFHGRLNWRIIVFGGTRGPTLFETVGNEIELYTFLSQPWYLNLIDWLSGKKPESGRFSQLHSEDPWLWHAQDPVLDKIRSGLKQHGELHALGDLCDIKLGINISSRSRDIVTSSGIPLLTGKGLTTTGIKPDETKMLDKNCACDGGRLRVGDILTRRLWNKKPFFFLVTEPTDVLATDSIVILRNKAEGVQPEYISEFLNSEIAEPLIRAVTSHSISLLSSALHKLPIPISTSCSNDSSPPDQSANETPEHFENQESVAAYEPAVQKILDQIQSVEAMLEERVRGLGLERNECRLSLNSTNSNTKLQELSDRTTLIAKSMHLAEQFEFKVSTFYPFPLAYPYRTLRGIVNPAECYQEILRIWENFLAFVASVSLALLTPQHRRSAGIDPKSWCGGISPGHWRDIVRLAGIVLEGYEEVALCQYLSALKISDLKRPFGKSCELLLTSINDFKHHRGPRSEEEYIEGCKQLQSGLRVCMESVSYLTRYPIRQVKDINASRNGNITLTCLRYMGDHPGFIQEIVEFGHALPKNDLYVEVSSDTWISLYPFLTVRSCPHCKSKETYFLDSWNTKKQVAQLKSFERGHAESDKDIHNFLSRWTAAQGE